MRVTLTAKLTNLGPHFRIELEFGVLVFCGGMKTGEPGEKPSEQGREPTTKSCESNPSYNGGRRALSPLRHPCSLVRAVARKNL